MFIDSGYAEETLEKASTTVAASKLYLKVDRLKFCVDGMHCALCQDALKTISTLFWNSGSTSSAWKFSKQTKPHFQYAHVKLPDGSVAHLKYGQSHGQRKAFLQFNPALIAKASFHYLDHLLGAFFSAGYSDLCAHGRASEIDYAFDVPHANFHDFAFVDTRLQCHYANFSGKGTMYIGSPAGRREMRIYDKQAELNKGGIVHEEALLRIEASLLMKSKHTLNELIDAAGQGKLADPFAWLLVLSRAQLATGKFSGAMGQFASSVAEGVAAQAAYRSLLPLPAKRLAMLKSRLSELNPPWWSPASDWENSVTALSAVRDALK